MVMSVMAPFTGRINKGHPIKICGKEVTQKVTARFLWTVQLHRLTEEGVLCKCLNLMWQTEEDMKIPTKKGCYINMVYLGTETWIIFYWGELWSSLLNLSLKTGQRGEEGVNVSCYQGRHRRKLKSACCVDKHTWVPSSSEEMLKAFWSQQGGVSHVGSRNEWMRGQLF